MGKRRRERDRPKDRPEALYDPNKRILLTYDQADDDVQDEIEATQSGLANADIDHPTINVADKDAAEDVNGDHVTPHSEANKPDGEHVGPRQYRSSGKRRAQLDEPGGQRATFGPGGLLSGNTEWDEFYEADSIDALAYLQAVRCEREDIPEVLIAPRRHSDVSEEAPSQAHPEDDSSAALDSSAVNDEVWDAAQEVYSRRLLARFDALHKSLQIVSHSPPDQYNAIDQAALSERKRLLQEELPHIGQLRAITPHTARLLLNVLQDSHLTIPRPIPQSASTWIFSLMARLEEYPRMHMEKIGELRDIAKQAAQLRAAIALTATGETVDRPTNRASSPGDADDSHSRASSPGDAVVVDADEESAWINTAATLDMILVIIGERFGQKDLLVERAWLAG